MGDQGRPGSGPIRFKTTFTNTIYEAMKRRGWKETNSDSDWDFIWAERDIAYDTFDTRHLLSWQRVNHFRNDRELCRKDLLVKNLKKRKRSIQKEGQQDEADRSDFWPTTYVLPGEYALFAEESKRRANSKWIMKPIARSQGRGIFIVTKLSQISKWKSDSRWEKTKEDGPGTYVVQRYVTNPYLVAGRKFDMRLYVLVTSYMPLTVWVYRAGFCRFSHARYSNATEDLEDMEKHLTNVAIQKRTESYDKEFGGKWGLRQLKLHLMALHGVPAVNTLFYEIQSLILRSLLSVQQVMINDKHCFGLYGYDILFDEKLKPWLLEVNASPSLSANTPADKELKVAMLSSVLDVIDLEGQNHGDEIRVGGFDLIHSGGPVGTNTPHATTSRGSAGSSVGAVAMGGEKNTLYTTALGAEIPQHRVDRMPRAPESSTNLPPSGASTGIGKGNGSDGGGSRRHSSSCSSSNSGGGAGGGGSGTGASAGEAAGATGGGGTGGSGISQGRNSGRVGSSGSSGGGAGGGGGGSSGSGSGSGPARSSLSSTRGTRSTSSSDSLSRGDNGGGRVGRGDGVRGQGRVNERSASGVGGGSGGTSGGSGGGGGWGRVATVGKAGSRSGDHHHQDTHNRDRGKDYACRSFVASGNCRDNSRDARDTAPGEEKDKNGKRGTRSPLTRPAEDIVSSGGVGGSSSLGTSFPPTNQRSSTSLDSDRLLTPATTTAARKCTSTSNSFSFTS